MNQRQEITRDAVPACETTVYPINKDYRFRRHQLQVTLGSVEIWNLERRATRKGKDEWRFVANDRSPIRLGLYCARRGIMPDAENADLLSSLACRSGK